VGAAMMKRYPALFVILIIFCSLVSHGFAYVGDIDFLYSGGAYMMDKTGYEDTVIDRFVRALFTAAGLKREAVHIRNVDDEKELFRLLHEGSVAVANVSPTFFKSYASELKLIPLVVPEIKGKAYIYYYVIARTENQEIKGVQNLWGKRVSLLDYSDYWYADILQMLEIPEVILRKGFPNNESIILSVLNETADAGILSDYYLNQFFSSSARPRKEIKIITKTKRRLIPPIVYQKGKLTGEEVLNIVGILENAHNNDQIRSILLTMGFSGFRRITREEIIKR
jgi:ABC-type phosphate/phosphonate transport system substrate-binding protein